MGANTAGATIPVLPFGYHNRTHSIEGEEHEVRYGPVDVVVLAMGDPQFDGSILNELQRLVEAGTIRVLDAMILVKGDDGAAIGVDIEDFEAAGKAKLGFIDTGTRGLFDAEDSATLAEGMVPGSAIVALAIENRWAVGLLNAFESAGADIAMHTRIPAPIFDDAMARIAAAQE
jgi:hypothetical protein